MAATTTTPIATALTRHLAYAESAVSSHVLRILCRFCDTQPIPAPGTRGLPLISSPAVVLAIVGAYLAVCAVSVALIRVLRLKPRERESRLMVAYVAAHNLFLFGLSAYMMLGIALEWRRLRMNVWGSAAKPEHKHMAWLIYLFYISKYFEFGDTLIMIVRCSVRQISFLHVYHHSSITLIWWWISYFAPGGDAYFSAALNSGVHVAMYGYYFLAAVIGKDPKRRAKYLFWGRYLTQAQMLQFCLNMVQSAYLLFGLKHAPYPRCLVQLLFYYMMTLLAMFGHFYLTKYRSDKDSAKHRTPAASAKVMPVNGSHMLTNGIAHKKAQ